MTEMKVRASVDNLNQVLAFVDTELEKLECPIRAQMQIDVAVEELFVNIASYAYAPGEGDAVIRVESTSDPKTVSITFLDRGIPYDPLAKPDPDVTLSAAERAIGGLAKKSMDEMKYAYRDGQNILTIMKKLG